MHVNHFNYALCFLLKGLIGSCCKMAMSGWTKSHSFFLDRCAFLLTRLTWFWFDVHSAISSCYISKALWVLPFPGGLFEDVTVGAETFLSTAWCLPEAGIWPSGQWLQKLKPELQMRALNWSFEFTCLHIFSRRRVNFKTLKNQGCEESHSSNLK